MKFSKACDGWASIGTKGRPIPNISSRRGSIDIGKALSNFCERAKPIPAIAPRSGSMRCASRPSASIASPDTTVDAASARRLPTSATCSSRTRRLDETTRFVFDRLAPALEDADFEITHVVRGDDHLPNTPRQMQIFYALGLTPPAYAHLPMVMGPDGQKLSKRHGATSVFAYRDLGYFPEALLNYLVRLGWSHGDQEIFSREEMFEYFDFANCGKSAGIFNAEKLLWLNFHYLKERPLVQLAQEVKPFIARKGLSIPGDDEWLQKMLATLRERAKTLVELVDFADFYLNDEIRLDPKAAAKFL